MKRGLSLILTVIFAVTVIGCARNVPTDDSSGSENPTEVIAADPAQTLENSATSGTEDVLADSKESGESSAESADNPAAAETQDTPTNTEAPSETAEEATSFFWSRNGSGEACPDVTEMDFVEAVSISYITRTEGYQAGIGRHINDRDQLEALLEIPEIGQEIKDTVDAFLRKLSDASFFEHSILLLQTLWSTSEDIPLKPLTAKTDGDHLVLTMEQQGRSYRIYNSESMEYSNSTLILVVVPRTEQAECRYIEFQFTAVIDGVPTKEAVKRAKKLTEDTKETGAFLIDETDICKGTYEVALSSVADKDQFLSEMQAKNLWNPEWDSFFEECDEAFFSHNSIYSVKVLTHVGGRQTPLGVKVLDGKLTLVTIDNVTSGRSSIPEQTWTILYVKVPHEIAAESPKIGVDRVLTWDWMPMTYYWE